MINNKDQTIVIKDPSSGIRQSWGLNKYKSSIAIKIVMMQINTKHSRSCVKQAQKETHVTPSKVCSKSRKDCRPGESLRNASKACNRQTWLVVAKAKGTDYLLRKFER